MLAVSFRVEYYLGADFCRAGLRNGCTAAPTPAVAYYDEPAAVVEVASPAGRVVDTHSDGINLGSGDQSNNLAVLYFGDSLYFYLRRGDVRVRR